MTKRQSTTLKITRRIRRMIESLGDTIIRFRGKEYGATGRIAARGTTLYFETFEGLYVPCKLATIRRATVDHVDTFGDVDVFDANGRHVDVSAA